MLRVELCPGESVLFISQGGTDEHNRHFLQILKEAWRIVPLAYRQSILNYYRKHFRGDPYVVLGARLNNKWPIAMAGGEKEGFMLWCDLLRIFDLPGKDRWAVLVMAEDLAHAYLIATLHPTHISEPPNDSPASKEYQHWDKAREDAMKEVLYSWPFVDREEHAKGVAWAIETKSGLNLSK